MGTAALQARTREWPSFHGEPVPQHSDPFEVGQDFIRALHHRLCQPITTLSCTLELMQLGREADVGLTEQLRIAMTQSDHLVELMSTFRQLFEAETSEAGDHAVLLDAVVGEVLEDFRPLAEVQQLAIDFKGKSNLFVGISTGALRQTLWNVIQNCIELSRAKSAIQIDISGAGVNITDTVPLSAEEMANIFDPFSFCQGGIGAAKISNLPLALAQRLVSAAGGSLLVRPTEDSTGREFHIHLQTATPQHPAGSAA